MGRPAHQSRRSTARVRSAHRSGSVLSARTCNSSRRSDCARQPSCRPTIHGPNRSDEELANLIRADGIDVLVALVGHMRGHRLLVFARKPAPIQVTAWGEPTGTGLGTMDYLFADPVLVPAAERGMLTETVLELPNFLGFW